MLEKVTIFITRDGEGGRELLLFRHPHAGIQLPAGTVEPGESPEDAALREAFEETGLGDVRLASYLGAREWFPPDGYYGLIAPATVYARPDVTSFAWAKLPRGSAVVKVERREPPFAHITYQEWDDLVAPQYVTYQITGWVDENALVRGERRHFFHGQTSERTPGEWHVRTDNHLFTLFWAPLQALPPLERYQQEWLHYFPR